MLSSMGCRTLDHAIGTFITAEAAHLQFQPWMAKKYVSLSDSWNVVHLSLDEHDDSHAIDALPISANLLGLVEAWELQSLQCPHLSVIDPEFLTDVWFFTIRHGHVKALKQLMGCQSQIDVLTSGNRGDSALMLTVRAGAVEMCDILLAHGANVHLAQVGSAIQPLMMVCMRREESAEDIAVNLQLCQRLLQAGASPVATTTNGWNALMFAAAKGSLSLVQCLLEAGAPVQAVNAQGLSAFQLADHHNHGAVCDCMAAHAVGRRRSTSDSASISGGGGGGGDKDDDGLLPMEAFQRMTVDAHACL
jgi:hypothetical protein